MRIIIDEQHTIEVSPILMSNEDDTARCTIAFSETHAILDAWVKLDPLRRNFRYGSDDSDDEPSVIYVAEANGDQLDFFDIEPHWDGRSTRNAYRLVDLTDLLPLRVVS